MKAMILCAGFGTRLGNLTKETPKPMLPINGHPLLEYLIAHLRANQITEIMVNLHFMPEIITNYFGDGSKFGVHLTYSFEPELLGTAGGIKKAGYFFKDQGPFLVQYGDILTDQNFLDLYNYHMQPQALATLLLHQRVKSNSVISLDENNKIIGFLERPSDEERKGVVSPWVNSGVAILDPEILAHIPAEKPCDLPRDIYSNLFQTTCLFGFPLTGYRCAIDSPQRYVEASDAISSKNCMIEMNNNILHG
jgi:NDP-sugar pyrophosphorylase family protein